MSTEMMALIPITLFAATVNGALGYGFSSITVPIALLFYTNQSLPYQADGGGNFQNDLHELRRMGRWIRIFQSFDRPRADREPDGIRRTPVRCDDRRLSAVALFSESNQRRYGIFCRRSGERAGPAKVT